MGVPKQHFYISVEDYLAGEKISPARHEYIDGVVYAMAGGTARHNQIAKNIGYRLDEHLDSGKCRAFIVDMKTRVNPTLYYYPDVVVTCEEIADTTSELTAPCLIIEVLSPSPAATDRREKLREYRYLPSLQEYVIVWQDETRVEIYRRQDGDLWQMLQFTQPDEEITFTAVGLTLPLTAVYRQVNFA